jgi:hypothetical protein
VLALPMTNLEHPMKTGAELIRHSSDKKWKRACG